LISSVTTICFSPITWFLISSSFERASVSFYARARVVRPPSSLLTLLSHSFLFVPKKLI
jgi:predicted LPLAT superfamily acyltransferase